MAKTETATVVSITVNGKTSKLNAKDAVAFAWHIVQAAECAVEDTGEASVVLATLPGGGMKVHGSTLQEVIGRRRK
jgi:hypothetical protein